MARRACCGEGNRLDGLAEVRTDAVTADKFTSVITKDSSSGSIGSPLRIKSLEAQRGGEGKSQLVLSCAINPGQPLNCHDAGPAADGSWSYGNVVWEGRVAGDSRTSLRAFVYRLADDPNAGSSGLGPSAFASDEFKCSCCHVSEYRTRRDQGSDDCRNKFHCREFPKRNSGADDACPCRHCCRFHLHDPYGGTR